MAKGKTAAKQVVLKTPGMGQLVKQVKALTLAVAPKPKSAKKKRQRNKLSFGKMERISLDFHAMCYAKLLLDPCKAKLCHPVYPEPGSGYLVRTHVTALGHTTSAKNAGYCIWFGFP